MISLCFGCDICFYICLFLLLLFLFVFFLTGSVYVYSLQHYVINLLNIFANLVLLSLIPDVTPHIKSCLPFKHIYMVLVITFCINSLRDRRARNHIVVEFKTNCTISPYHHSGYEFDPVHDEVYSMRHYVT